MDLETFKEPTLKDVLDEIKGNTRESKMIQNFLFKILESSLNQEKLLKELNRNVVESNKINMEIKRILNLR